MAALFLAFADSAKAKGVANFLTKTLDARRHRSMVRGMRNLLLLLCVLGTIACGGLTSQLKAAEQNVAEAQFEQADHQLAELESSVAELSKRERFHYYYLQAFLAQQLSSKKQFTHYLYLAGSALEELDEAPPAKERWIKRQLALRSSTK